MDFLYVLWRAFLYHTHLQRVVINDDNPEFKYLEQVWNPRLTHHPDGRSRRWYRFYWRHGGRERFYRKKGP